jgi:hypothetical protein
MTARPWGRCAVRAAILCLTVAAASGAGFSACTKHDGLILLNLRSSGPFIAEVVYIRMSAKGWPTRITSGTVGTQGFQVGYYGPADGNPVTVTVEALDGSNCVLGQGSATVPALDSGATSDPVTVFVRPVSGNNCTVVDAGSDAGSVEDAGGGEDVGTGAPGDAGNDATADTGTDAGADATADASDDATAD